MPSPGGTDRARSTSRTSSRRPGAPVRRVEIDQGRVDTGRWPYAIPAVRHLCKHGLDLGPGITVIIGSNGSGKSTIVEAIAANWARRVGAFRNDWMQSAVGRPSAEDSDLHRSIRLYFTRGGPTGGLFLRAERLHAQAGFFAGEKTRGRWSDRLGDAPILTRSHGEGFLEILNGMLAEPGLYLLDEPESALSFESSLTLLHILVQMRAHGSQIILATHSPMLAAVPDAQILQLDGDGIAPVDYDAAALVSNWRAFLEAPQRFLRHIG